MRGLPLAKTRMGLVLGSLALGTLLAAPVAASDALQGLPAIEAVAPDAVQISPHVPHMGQHWAVPANLPTGPIYCVIDGRVVCVEYMFDASDLADGRNWTGLLPGIDTPPIRHVDMEYKPEGIEPHPVPLYQLHIYFVDQALLATH